MKEIKSGASLRERVVAAVAAMRGEIPTTTPKRRALPDRRSAEHFKFQHQNFTWYATVGRYEDGSVAEIFLSSGKPGDSLRALAEDAAMTASIALQYGCPFEDLRHTISRESGGEPTTPLAAVLAMVEPRP